MKKYKVITCEKCKKKTYKSHPLKRFCSEKCRKDTENERRLERKTYRKRENRKIIRKVCIKIKGGKCSVCGKTKVNSLQFHHTKPSDKAGNISSLIRNNAWKVVAKELKKCVLVCDKCHRKIHSKDMTKHIEVERIPIKIKFKLKKGGYVNIPATKIIRKQWEK